MAGTRRLHPVPSLSLEYRGMLPVLALRQIELLDLSRTVGLVSRWLFTGSESSHCVG